MKEKEIENTCYECGSPISTLYHFCHNFEARSPEEWTCSRNFFSKFENNKKAIVAIATITRWRKLNNLPRFHNWK